MKKSLLLLCGCLAGGIASAGTTINVPGDFATIQAGLDGANSGDTVLVAPGTYSENELNFNGKDIELRSSGGRDVTTIDGQKLAMVFRIEQGEGRGCIIDGFTIQNGSTLTFAQGGAFFISGSAPTIRNNRIINNENMSIRFGPDPMDDADDDFGNGGAIKISSGSNPLIENNIISNNTAIGSGGAMRARAASAEIRNNVFDANTAIGGTSNGIPDSNGGALSMSSMDSLVIDGNVFTNNIASSVGGAISAFDVDTIISNNMFTGNSAPLRAGAIRLEDEKNVGPRTMTIQGNMFINNSTEAKGGAIAAFFEAGTAATQTGGSTYNIIDNEFIGNTAFNAACINDLDPACANSGALSVTRTDSAAGEMLVRNNLFDGNSADENGAIQFNKPNVIFEDNQVLNNSARFRYSGVSCQHKFAMPCVIRRNVFRNNASTETASPTGRNAGAIYIKDTGSVTIENNWLIENSGYRAGAVYYLATNGLIVNNTFVDNVTAFAGGASLYLDGDVDVYNNIFDGDTRGIRRDDAMLVLQVRDNDFFNQSTAMVRLESTDLTTIADVNAQTFASGNLDKDPLYVDRVGNDFHLSAKSELIDAGNCATAAGDDIDAQTRPLGPGCDVGADEFDPMAADRVFADGFEG